MTYIPETLRQAREALLQSATALTTIAQSLERADAPEPGEWCNHRPPTFLDASTEGDVWHWYGGIKEIAYKSVDGVRQTYGRGMTPYWAPGNRPAPKSPPPSVVANQEAEPPPKPPTGKWIVGPLPTEADANFENDVKVPNVLDPTCPYEWAKYYVVQPGAPWCSPDDNPGPWDPTTLDRNGWIRSRLPTEKDTGLVNMVRIPAGHGGTTAAIAYDLIIPGQPWAPWDSTLGRFEK